MSGIKETVLKFTNTVAKTSGELVKSTKLSINLASEEDKLKSLYTEIGKKVHEIYIYGGTLGAAFDDNIRSVEAQQEKIKDLRNKIDAVKGTKTCFKCGKTMERSAEFCPKCGQRADAAPDAGYKSYGVNPSQSAAEYDAPPDRRETAPPVPIEEPPEPPAQTTVKTCVLCGKENEIDSRFCLHCGRVL